MRAKSGVRRGYVRRRGPCPAFWITTMLMAALFAFVFFARPTIRELAVDQAEAPASAERFTRDISFDALETHMVELARLTDAATARVEAARFVPRGAAGYVLKAGDTYLVLGAGYDARAEADKVAAQLAEDEQIATAVHDATADAVQLRVTATEDQLQALTGGEQLLRTMTGELGAYALSLDRGERQITLTRAALSIAATEAVAAREQLSRAAGDTPNAVASQLIELLSALGDECAALAESAQETPLTFSSRLKYAHVALRLAHVEFLKGLSA